MTFVFGKEEYLINLEVKKLLKKYQTKANFYDETATIEDIIMDIATVSMFSNQKLIVIRDHPIFIDENESNNFLEDFKKIKLKDVNLIFVLTLPYKNSNSLISYLMINANLRKIKSINAKDLGSIIHKIVKENGGKISNSAVIKLIQKLPLNLRLIVNEIKKLLLESKDITDQKVDRAVDNYYSEDYFALSNAIVNNNKHSIIKYYNEKVNYGEEPVSIIGQITNALSLSILVDNYKKQGFSLQQISYQINIHIFRIKKANQLLLNQNLQKISDLIIKLADLEVDIKTKSEDNTRGVEKFILDLIR